MPPVYNTTYSATDFHTPIWHSNGTATPHHFGAEALEAFIRKYIKPVNASDSRSVGQIEAVRREITAYYSSVEDDVPPYIHFQRYTRLLSDLEFIIPSLWEARLKAQSRWPVYLVHFGYADPTMLAHYPYRAVGHVSEYPYTIGRDYFGRSFDESSDIARAVRTRVLASIVRFVKTGEPSADWPRLDFPAIASTSCARAIEGYCATKIGASGLCAESGARSCGEESWEQSVANRLDFWDRLSASYDLRQVHSFPNTLGQCLPRQHGGIEGHSASSTGVLKLSLALSTTIALSDTLFSLLQIIYD